MTEGMGAIRRIDGIALQWGESLRWDDRRQRLYFVDCGTHRLHWLDGGEPPLDGIDLPGLPTGLVLTEDERVLVALDDGFSSVDPDSGRVEFVTPYPDGMNGRANDAAADLDGNLVTGTLNLMPGPGSYWWYSAREGWRRLDDGISNANGPVVTEIDGTQTLVFADTHAATLYAYDYDGASGVVANKRIFAATIERNGFPDGACADADGGIWSCLLAAGTVTRYTRDGVAASVPAGVEMPSSVAFGGASLDTMFFTSIAVDVGGIEITSPDAGGVMAVTGLGVTGRPEPRFRF